MIDEADMVAIRYWSARLFGLTIRAGRPGVNRLSEF
jgi:hypothetical protein